MDRIGIAIRGDEIFGNVIFCAPADDEAADAARAPELLAMMYADQPTISGDDIVYGPRESHRLRLWRSRRATQKAPSLILFVHGGSWKVGTYLDSLGSAKVEHLLSKGYAFATVDYSLFPVVEVEEQVQEVANALSFLVKNSASLGIDAKGSILMGHSSGAHVVALLGTDTSYLETAGLDQASLKGVICLDGSNYNTQAEIFDSPGSVAINMMAALGTDPAHLHAMSPTFHASSASKTIKFLLLHVQRRGDIRQAVEFSAALHAAGIDASLHVFEGAGFEGHMQMLLRLGLSEYPATLVMDKWLHTHAPVAVV